MIVFVCNTIIFYYMKKVKSNSQCVLLKIKHAGFLAKAEKSRRNREDSNGFGGDKRDRTADLLNAIQALSQLSYTPIFTSQCFCMIP